MAWGTQAEKGAALLLWMWGEEEVEYKPLYLTLWLSSESRELAARTP